MQQILLGIFYLLFVFTLSAADIAVITIAHGEAYQNLVKLGIENKHLYCKKHGYDFFCCEDSLDASRPICWSKIPLALKILNLSNYKWVVWIDADTLVMNLDIPLEEIIDERYNFLITAD